MLKRDMAIKLFYQLKLKREKENIGFLDLLFPKKLKAFTLGFGFLKRFMFFQLRMGLKLIRKAKINLKLFSVLQDISMKKILIISICKERLHYYEFVKPIEDIVKKSGKKFFTKHYTKLNSLDVEKAERIIICGTSLKDNDFMKHLKNFMWIKTIDKPVLGICGGMEIIGMVYQEKLKNNLEIGFYEEKFTKEFLGIYGIQEVYHLHNYYVNFLSKYFFFFTEGKIAQAVRHREREIYGVLFHPEVRQKNLITQFLEKK